MQSIPTVLQSFLLVGDEHLRAHAIRGQGEGHLAEIDEACKVADGSHHLRGTFALVTKVADQCFYRCCFEIDIHTGFCIGILNSSLSSERWNSSWSTRTALGPSFWLTTNEMFASLDPCEIIITFTSAWPRAVKIFRLYPGTCHAGPDHRDRTDIVVMGNFPDNTLLHQFGKGFYRR